MRLILHNFLCYFNPLRGRFACFAELKIKREKKIRKRKQSKRDQTEGGQLRACIIFGSLVLGETQWGERGEARMAAQNHIWQFWRWLLFAFLDSLIPCFSFRLLEGWPPGLGKGEISCEWRREAELPAGSFQPAWTKRPSN